MSDIISILPDAIANQIAAGEVIQRPASLVKELMENAVDAGATNVRLIIKDAGKTLIQVIDNGKGMSDTDARMCWERHATSKIRKAQDLFSIRSFGFRGEALASIAAVAQVEMKTRTANADTATLICIEGSEVKKQEDCMAPLGTSIAVKNLFFNIPARRNFLKSNAIEVKHILDEFSRVALPNPGVSFSLHHNDNLLYDLAATSLKQRICDLLSIRDPQKLMEGQEDSPLANFRVFLGNPDIAKKTRGDQYFFVNGRYIKDPYLHHAVMAVYDELLPKDFFPVYVILFDLDPAKVDINVHPTKTEVKFEEERALYILLKSVVKKAVAENHLLPAGEEQGNFDTSFERMLQDTNKPDFPTAPRMQINRSFNPFDNGSTAKYKRNPGEWEKMFEPLRDEENLRFQPAGQDLFSHKKELKAELPEIVINADEVMQALNGYIVASVNGILYIIDQQSGHEKVLYEQYRKNLQASVSASQQLLFPRVVEFSPADSSLIAEIIEDINHLGLDISEFGSNSFIINGLPADFNKTEAKELLEGLIEEYKRTTDLVVNNKKDALARAMARQSSIRKGKTLTRPEMVEMVKKLFACENPGHLPDGRRVFINFDRAYLEKNLL